MRKCQRGLMGRRGCNHVDDIQGSPSGIRRLESCFPQFRLANRPPTDRDDPHTLWWYDYVNKIMYIATETVYIRH
jgi:hypothetical protein